MNIIDISIVALIILGAILGFKRGVFSELVSAIGFIVSVVLAFLFKNPVSEFMYSHLPFFKFGGLLKGVPVLNIVVYEIIAFLIMLAVFLLVVNILKVVTKLFELVLKMTIVLSIPSKILGALVGMLEYFVLTFIILYILSLPTLSSDIIKDSKFKDNILNNTPILSSFVKKSMNVFEEFEVLKEKYKDSTKEQFNNEAMDLLLKYKVVTVKSADKLIKQKKISVDNKIIDKYREE